MSKLLKLTKPWAGLKPGATLEVLAPGENPSPGKVDAARAATLLHQQLAVEVAASAASAKPATPAKAAQQEEKEA